MKSFSLAMRNTMRFGFNAAKKVVSSLIPSNALAAWLFAEPPGATSLVDEKNTTGDARTRQPGRALSFDGVDDRIAAAHLIGSETITSNEGTSTPTISAGRIDFTAGTCSHIEISDGTVYHCEESTGTTVYDSSGNGNHGTLFGGVARVEDGTVQRSWANDVGYTLSGSVIVPRDESDPTKDVLGGSLQYTGKAPLQPLLVSSPCRVFDGVDDHIGCGPDSPIRILGDLAVSVFAMFDSFGQFRSIVASEASGETEPTNSLYWLYQEVGPNRIGYIHEYGAGNNEQFTFTSTLSTGRWYHLAIVRDATAKTVKLFVDGVESGGTFTYTNAPTGGSLTSLRLGAFLSNANAYLHGRLSDLRIYNSTLSAIEVGQISSQASDQPIPTAGWYPLSEKSGTTAHNVLANSNHGTVLGGAAVGTQDVFHYGILYGHDGSSDEIPALTSGASAADGGTLNNPAVIGHNDARTDIDFTGGVANDPEIYGRSIPTAYSFGDSLPAAMTKRVVSTEQEDRFTLLEP